MEVILLENVRKLGHLGQRVKVAAGYGRNFLLPKGKALSATVANLKRFEERRHELEQSANEKTQLAQSRVEALAALHIRLSVRAGDEGKLFGSVTAIDLVAALKEQGVVVHRQEIRLPHGPLRQTGEHNIELQLQSDIIASLKVTLVPGA